MNAVHSSERVSRLPLIASLAIATLLGKVLITILLEYRWYFPPDFNKGAFLIGRKDTFFGLYSIAFYAHILVGPLVVLLSVCLMLSGKWASYRDLHRVLGKALVLAVIGILVPSGLVMAWQPIAGPIAGFGFAALAIATGSCAALTFFHARVGRIRSHRIWASRCFLLLCSPLLLRLTVGATIVTGTESDGTYRVIAWLSWLGPLAILEVWIRYASFLGVRSQSPLNHSSEAFP